MLGSGPIWCRNAQEKTQTSRTLLARNSVSQPTQVPLRHGGNPCCPAWHWLWGSLGDDGSVKAPAVKPAWFLLSSPRPGPNFLKAPGQRFTVKSSPGYPKALSCCCSGHNRSCPRQGEGQWQLCNPGGRNPPELMPASTHACCASIAQTQTGLWVRGPHSHSG